MGKRAAALLLSAVLCVPAGAAPQATQQVEQRPARAPVLLESLQRQDWAAVSAGIAQLLAQAEDTPLESERRLFELALALRNVPASATLRASLEELSRYTPRALRPHREHRRTIQVPAYPVHTAARGTLRWWDQRVSADHALALLSQGDYQELPALAPQALALAVSRAPAEQLRAWEAAGMPALAPAPQLALARRLGTMTAYRRLLEWGDVPEAYVALAEIPQHLAAADAAELLRQTSDQPALAGAAVLAFGRLSSAAARDKQLLDWLADADRGAAAALALARRGLDDTRRRQVVDQARTGTPAAVRNALLALHLDGSAAARHDLQAAAEWPQLAPELRAQVRQWLR